MKLLTLYILLMLVSCGQNQDIKDSQGPETDWIETLETVDAFAGTDAEPDQFVEVVDDSSSADDSTPVDGSFIDEHAPDSTAIEPPLSGFGAIAGECGIIGEHELDSSGTFFFSNSIDFMSDPYDEDDYSLLTPGGQKIVDDGNAGGSSLHSEVFSFEVLARCEFAALLKTEMEIEYSTPGKMTDLLTMIHDRKTGVSVTRAVSWPHDRPWTASQATELLEKKLLDIIESTANAAEADKWGKQILHVLAFGPGHEEVLKQAWAQIDADILGDTIVLVTVTDGDDGFVY